jgi:hypothetical protein
MLNTTDHRRRLGRAVTVLVAAAAVTGLIGLVGANGSSATGTLTAPQPTAATAVRPEPTATSAAPEPTPADRFLRTELYFGTDRPGERPDVTDRQFDRFVNGVVTPRFPDGLTQLEGYGQFRSSSGVIIEEQSFLIILLYPTDDADANREIEEIRTAYKKAFQQESVLRADSTERISF